MVLQDEQLLDPPCSPGESFLSVHRWVSPPGEDVPLSSPLQVALSGCTACVVHISNGVLHVANLGDSRAVLGVQELDGSWSAVSLTSDHNAQNPDELQRVLREHPSSERRTVVRHDRLLGVLLPFRAFGDFRFKWSAEMLSRVYETRADMLPPHYLTPPYLSARPEVTQHRIRANDRFVVLATDGLWELMHRQRVVQLVGEQLTGETTLVVKWTQGHRSLDLSRPTWPTVVQLQTKMWDHLQFYDLNSVCDTSRFLF